jgi:8-oxo-dGTP diphosphatase
MAPRDGDGWVQCRCGGKHWGLHGAAGLLLSREGTLLLQHRSEWVHNGDTWGIPGGARDSHETPVEAAIREAIEEAGIDPHFLTVHLTHTDDHIDWRYDTIIATAAAELIPHQMNAESQELRWMKWEDIDSMVLHPSFAKSWPAVQSILIELFGQPAQ